MLDALDRVRGSVAYPSQLRLPGMLVAAVRRSPIPHGRILRIDLKEAEQVPGVVAVLSGLDRGRPGSPDWLYGALLKDQPLLAAERVRYVGEPIALVAAENFTAAAAAAEAIQVDTEEEAAVYDPVEAARPGAPVLHEGRPDNCFVHGKLRHGDVEAGFKRADFVLEETFTSPVAQQTSLEPHSVVAQWDGSRLTVWTGSQAPYIVRRVLAEIFHLEPEQVRVVVPPLGGGYGGKGHVRIEPMVAALAAKTGGRPVKLVLSRAEEFATVTKHAAIITIKSGVKADGDLTARQITLHWGGGAYADASPGLVRAGIVRSVGPYRIPAVQVDSFGVYTNLPPAAAYRGAMSSQTTWASESHTDSIARRLGIDPLEYRRRGLLRPGDTFATGETMHDIHFLECLEASAESLGWASARPPDIGPLRRGRGLAVMMKSTLATSRSSCRLELDEDGGLTLYTSTVEMGQGAHTALAQLASEFVGVPLHRVRVRGPDTQVTPFDSTTSASRSTGMMGEAIRKAASSLRDKLIEAAAPLLEVPPEELEWAPEAVRLAAAPDLCLSYADILRRHGLRAIEASGTHETEGGIDQETGQGVASPHWHQGAGACEVEVDTETGKVRVLRYAAAAYAGKVVNPILARLQNEGNVVFGLGPALLEEVVFDHGQPVNPNLSDYMLPSFLDVPADLVTRLLEAEGAEIHGIGEMTLPPVAPAIANAVFDAVGVRIRDLPITAEKVLRAWKERARHA